MKRAACIVLAALLCAGCRPSPAPAQPDDSRIHRGQDRFGLSFEERMAIPAELSRLRADAQRRADEVYDPFRSKENAVRNEEMTARLMEASKNELLTRNSLTPQELDEIVREYQESLGGNLR